MPNWVDIVVVVLEKELFKSRILFISPSCKGARSSICKHMKYTDPIGMLYIKLKLSQWFFNVKSLRQRNKTTMPDGIS